MAKDKKRGFFSWLGFGNAEQETQHTVEDQHDSQTLQQDADTLSTEQPVELHDETASTESVVVESTLENPSAEAAKIDEHPSEIEINAESHFSHVEIEQEIDSTEAILVEEAPVAEHRSSESIQDNTPFAESHESIELVDELEHQQHDDALHASVEKTYHNESETVEPADAISLVEEQDSIDHQQENEHVAEIYHDESELVEPADAISLVEEQDEEDQLEEAFVAQEQERPTKEGFFARLKRSLLRTKENLGSGFFGLFRNRKIDDDLFEELEEQLLIADVGVTTTRKIIDSLTQHVDKKKLNDAEALYAELKQDMSDILEKVSIPLDITTHKPFVILMVGVNGVGKTTTIGKLARQFQQEGKSVMLAAGDTFRAAAVEQLQVWGQRNNIPVVAQHTGADSASVLFDAVQSAKAKNVDVLIADTAGRLQNKSHLMEELKKIVRVMQKIDPEAPHEIMLTIDASTGQNAVSQAKLFHEAVGLNGITLTKLDGTAKGGVIFAVADQFNIPIRYIGVGEGIEDLRPFQSHDFIEALFSNEEVSHEEPAREDQK